MAEPIPVIPLEYENRADTAARTRWSSLARWTLLSAWAACVIAWALIVLVDVESVIVTGPVIAVLGTLTALMGLGANRAGCIGVGAAHVGVCLLFLVLVNWLNWSPGQATVPFAVMGGAHVVVTGLASAWILLRRPGPAFARI